MDTTIKLCERIISLKLQEAALAKERKRFESELLQIKDNELKTALDSDYGTGSKTFTDGDYKIKINVPKNVSWNQETLDMICQNIDASGDDSREYVEVKLNISETKYKAMPSYIKKAFEPARSVKAGNASITIEEITKNV